MVDLHLAQDLRVTEGGAFWQLAHELVMVLVLVGDCGDCRVFGVFGLQVEEVAESFGLSRLGIACVK